MSRNKYPEETVQKILDAALKLFLEKGYEETTVLDIVDGMGGLTRGAFYHHFKSKEEVLDALGDKLFYDENPFEKAKQQKGLNGLERFKYLLTLSFEDSDRRKISAKAIYALEIPAFLKKHITDNREVVTPLYEELIREGMLDGSIKTEHPKLLAELFTLMTNFWMIPSIFPSTPEESIERLMYLKEITEKLGLPIFDEQTIALCKKNVIFIE